MNKFKKGSAVVLAGLALWMASGTTYGLGLGHPVSRAILGDTLSVSVPVRLDAGEEFGADCVKADVYFGDDKVPAARVQAQLNTTAAPPGRKTEQVIQVRTSALINEPVVTVYVSAGCRTIITRKVVALVDPPDLKVPVAGNTASQPAASSGSSEPSATDVPPLTQRSAPPVKLVRDPVSRSSGLGRKAPSFALSEDASAPRSARSSRTVVVSKKAQPKRRTEAPRLVLDPVATDATVAPGLQMSGQLGAVTPEAEASSPEILQRRRSAAAIWQAMNASPEEMARDQARLEDLERKLDGLSRDSVRASEAVTGLQSRLAHQSAGGNGVVYGLGGLVALLLGALAWREWTLRKALAEQSSWLTSQSPEDSAPAADESQAAADGLPDIHHVLAQIDAELDQAKATAPSQQTQAVEAVAPNLGQDTTPAPIHDVPAPVAPRAPSIRDVSVDELIDLEQQAEFFLVLGQDESAIELLENYIHNSTAASPMPFLKLLEIYRQMGMRTAYERTRMNFNLRFNAHAALWDADLTHGHELKDYPGILERLQALWAYPNKALEVLERSLMRQDAESYTFDLPAYRELLFLYAVLRDLQGQEHAGHDQHHLSHRDLLVSSSPSWPVSGQAAGYAAGRSTQPAVDADLDLSSPLMATLPMKALPDLAPILSLDLELDDLYVEPAPTDHKP